MVPKLRCHLQLKKKGGRSVGVTTRPLNWYRPTGLGIIEGHVTDGEPATGTNALNWELRSRFTSRRTVGFRKRHQVYLRWIQGLEFYHENDGTLLSTWENKLTSHHATAVWSRHVSEVRVKVTMFAHLPFSIKIPWCWLPGAVDISNTTFVSDVACETCQWRPVAPPFTWRTSIMKFLTDRRLLKGISENLVYSTLVVSSELTSYSGWCRRDYHLPRGIVWNKEFFKVKKSR